MAVAVKPDMKEVGVSGVPQWAGRLQERYLASLRGPAGINAMATILRREPAAYTAHRLTLLSAGGVEWGVEPSADTDADKKAADFLEECWNDMSSAAWEAIKFALSAQAFGFADLEICWKRRQGHDVPDTQPSSAFDDGLIGIRKLAVRRQETVERWETDDSGGYQTMVQRDPVSFQYFRVPVTKLLHFVGGDDRSSWEGVGWLEPAYKLDHMIENYEILQGIGWQRSFTGLPTFTWLQVPDPADRMEVQRMGEALVVNEKQYVELPGPMVTFDLKTVTNSNAGELKALIDQLRWEIMSLVAMTFMRLGSTRSGSRALSDPLIDSYNRGVDASLDGIADTINRHLVPRLFAANTGAFPGMTGYPKIVHTSVAKVPLEVVNYLDKVQAFLTGAGPEDNLWLRELMDMPAVEVVTEDQPVLPVDQQPAPGKQPAQTGATDTPAGDGGNQSTTGQAGGGQAVTGTQGGGKQASAAAEPGGLSDLSAAEQVAILEAAARIVASGSADSGD